MIKNEKIKTVLQTLIDKKATDIRIFNVKRNSDMWDYIVICTALSAPHIKSLFDYLTETMEKDGFKVFYRDFGNFKNWVALDLGDMLIHIFDRETRIYYAIEKLLGENEEKLNKFIKIKKQIKRSRKNVYKN
jgi:ribosome-associated protein